MQRLSDSASIVHCRPMYTRDSDEWVNKSLAQFTGPDNLQIKICKIALTRLSAKKLSREDFQFQCFDFLLFYD